MVQAQCQVEEEALLANLLNPMFLPTILVMVFLVWEAVQTKSKRLTQEWLEKLLLELLKASELWPLVQPLQSLQV